MENTSANNYANKINFMSSSAIIMFIFSNFVYHSIIVVCIRRCRLHCHLNSEMVENDRRKRKILKRQQNNYYKFESIYASNSIVRYNQVSFVD